MGLAQMYMVRIIQIDSCEISEQKKISEIRIYIYVRYESAREWNLSHTHIYRCMWVHKCTLAACTMCATAHNIYAYLYAYADCLIIIIMMAHLAI